MRPPPPERSCACGSCSAPKVVDHLEAAVALPLVIGGEARDLLVCKTKPVSRMPSGIEDAVTEIGVERARR